MFTSWVGAPDRRGLFHAQEVDMPLYITVSRGARADAARPILASSDRRVVDAVLRTLARLNEGDQDDEGDPSDVARRLLGEEDCDASST